MSIVSKSLDVVLHACGTLLIVNIGIVVYMATGLIPFVVSTLVKILGISLAALFIATLSLWIATLIEKLPSSKPD
jgi:hypothetical protein